LWGWRAEKIECFFPAKKGGLWWTKASFFFLFFFTLPFFFFFGFKKWLVSLKQYQEMRKGIK
jgi:hypothetical protein